MRNILVLFSTICFCCTSHIEYIPDSFLIGNWDNIGKDYAVELVFMINNKFEIKFKNNYYDNSIFYKGNYIINNNIIPNTIDFKNIINYSDPIYSIIKKIDANTIQIAKLSNRWKLRSISFDKNNSLLFHRKI